MITFEHYIEFNKKFEDALSKLKEDGEIFNTETFGKIEKILSIWLNNNEHNINNEDLRILTTYLICTILKPEKYYKELKFLQEEIRLRGLVKHYSCSLSILDLLSYISFYKFKDGKKGFISEHFLQNFLKVLDKINTENIIDLIANLKAQNYEDPNLKPILKEFDVELV